MNAQITTSRRTRRTPFSQYVEDAGVRAYTVYNRMLLPAVFRSLEEDYHHLKSAVQVWDVSCERQVRLRGPDALRMLQLLTPRDLTKISTKRCMYVPITDQNGGMLNDPVAIKISDEEVWISIADSDLLFWVQAIAGCNGFHVVVDEAEVFPLAVQGPKATELTVRVFGDRIREMKFFGADRFVFADEEILITRTGYSKQGGFEIYVEGRHYAGELWHALFEAGADLDVRAGCPNLIERIEGGLLSFGNDMTFENTPLECGLGRCVDDSQLATCYGGRALAEERANGSQRMVRALTVSDKIPRCDRAWPLISNERLVGQITSAYRSPDFGVNVAIGMVDHTHWDAGTEMTVMTHAGPRAAKVQQKFWI